MRIQIGQAEFFTEEVVQGPTRPRRVAENGSGGKTGRGGKAAAQTPLPLARHDGVDCQSERIEFGRLTSFDHVSVEPLVLVDIELEHLGAASEGRNLFDRARRKAGDAEPQAEFFRRLGNGGFSLPMECSLHCCWREDEGKGAFPSKDRARRVDGLHPGEHIWHEIDVCIAISVASFGELIISCAIDVIEHREGQPRFG